MNLNDIFIFEEEQLNEINMSPSSLRQLAAQIDARAGMEFEMIVPNTEGNDPDESEPDYDQDERCRDIEQIVDFFDTDDYNSPDDIRRLERDLGDDYQEWKFEALGEAWDRQGFDYLREYIERYDEFDRDSAVDTARDEFIDANPDIPPDSEEAQRGISARVDELEEQFVQDVWDAGISGDSSIYDRAQEEFNDDEADDMNEYDWLRSRGYHFMTDIENSFRVTWPYWTYGSNGGRSSSEVADSFEYAIGKPVNHASGYHGARREPGKYVVEPDGSLEGDDVGDTGLEFVSPPMPVQELFDDLKKVKRWADREGCYTNESTGLHMNISVPSLQGSVENKLDFVKLAVLMGDKYVLDAFGRSGNTYCKSALGKVQQQVKGDPEKAKALLDQMKGHMNEFASRAIHGTTTHKYTSVNTKGGYVEFRGPGYDWLGDNFDKIENTMLRFVVALDAACDPQKYRKEYLTKLYKLLSPASESTTPDTIKYFADYVAGNIPKAALRSFVKQAQLQRKVAADPTGGQKYWWNVALNGQRIEVVATSKDEAWNKATDEYEEWMRYNKNQATITPLRPYQEASGQTLGGRRSNPDGNYVIVNIIRPGANETTRVAYRFMAASYNDALTVLRQWREEHGNQYDIKMDPQGAMGQPGQEPVRANIGEPQPVGRQTQQGNWGFWITSSDRFARNPGASDANDIRRFNSREEAEQFMANTPGIRSDIEVREITPAQSQDGGLFRGFENHGGDLTPRGPGPWEIYRLSNGETVRELRDTNRGAAEAEARFALGLRAEAPELYGVRTRQQASDIVAPGLGEPTRTQTVPGQPQQVFTGQWDVRLGGEIVFRVYGENQGVANQAAREWLLGRSREFLRDHEGQELEVTPRYE